MINKKLEINLGGINTQLWFNNYAVFELQSMYGVEQADIFKRVTERASENYLLLISDLIKVGIKGHCFAKGESNPDLLNEINEHIAIADISELMKVWEVFFHVLGGNIKPDKEKKKEDEAPKIAKQKPEPQTKIS